MKFFILTLLVGCSTTSTSERTSAWKAWEGKPVSLLNEHPYFKDLKYTKIKHEDGTQTIVMKDQTRYQTEAYCDGLGGCLPTPIYNCHSAFSVKDKTILGLEQSGTCPGYKVIHPEKL